MVKIDIEAAKRRYAKNCLNAFFEGKKSLKWIIGVIESSGVRGQILQDIFQELQHYGDPLRWQEAYQACQEQEWL